MTGVAFEFGDATYTLPNRSTASFAEGMMKTGRDHGMRKKIQGYWLDVTNGPYVSFGIECEKVNDYANGLFHVVNKGTGAEQHRHHAAEVALYNILGLMWELEVGWNLEMISET